MDIIVDALDIDNIKFDGTNYLFFKMFFMNYEDKFSTDTLSYCSHFVYTHFKSEDDFLYSYGEYCANFTECDHGVLVSNKKGDQIFCELPWVDVVCEMNVDDYFELMKSIHVRDKDDLDLLNGDDFRKFYKNHIFDNLQTMMAHERMERLTRYNEDIQVYRFIGKPM